jgi:hypothetical protein
VIESSFRYLAALTTDGSVDVWKLKAEQPYLIWDLNFKSVSQIEPSNVEN